MAAIDERNNAPQATKACGRCGKVFPLTSDFFIKSPLCRNGLAGTCRSCHTKRSTEWKRKNKSKVKKQRAALYQADPEKHDNYRKNWRSRNPLSALATSLRCAMKKRSADNNVPFDSDLFSQKNIVDYLKAYPTCECCDRRWRVAKDLPDDASPTFDRILPEKGYVAGNVALLCWRCNSLKRDATLPELETLVAWLRKVTDVGH